jgi:hypothetical protein
MQLDQNMRRATRRPTFWVNVLLVLLASAAIGWQATMLIPSSQPSGITKPSASTAAPLLDRGAERQPIPTPRVGGPRGHRRWAINTLSVTRY